MDPHRKLPRHQNTRGNGYFPPGSDMVIPPPPLLPPPRENMPSKPPPPRPQPAAIPWNPALSHPVQDTGGPPQAVHDSQGTEQDGTQSLPEGPEDGLSDDEKKKHPVQETEPPTEALGISQVYESEEDGGQDEALSHMDDGED